jgi:hypothetical protein
MNLLEQLNSILEKTNPKFQKFIDTGLKPIKFIWDIVGAVSKENRKLDLAGKDKKESWSAFSSNLSKANKRRKYKTPEEAAIAVADQLLKSADPEVLIGFISKGLEFKKDKKLIAQALLKKKKSQAIPKIMSFINLNK